MHGFTGRVRRHLAVAQSLLIVAWLLLPAAVVASVATDKWDYTIGETVQITGDEMAAGETVQVDVFFPDGALAQRHLVTAAEDGTFADSFFLAEGMPGGIYRVVATGLSSGAVFETEFDPASSSCMSGETPTVTAPTTASLTIGWLDDCNNEDGFRIRYGLSAGSLTQTVEAEGTEGDNNSRTKVIAGLACGTTYYFQVQAFRTQGNQSSTSNVVSGTTSPCPPADTTPPIITPTVSGTLGNDGWYVSDVTVTWTVDDAESPVTSTSGCDSTTISTDTTGTTLTCTATSAGGTASESVTIKRDATAPTISAALDRSPASTGWFNIATGAPTVSYTCTDATSGIASCTAPYTFGEGADQSHIGTAVDAAGNSATASVSDVDVDLTAPTITYLGQTPAPNANGWNNTEVTLSWSCTDATSGPVSPTVSETLSSEGANQSATGTCTDAAGNTASDTQSGIDIDLTPPTVSAAAAPAPNANGWNNTDVVVTFSGTDALSGIEACDPAVTLSAEGAGQSATGSCTDRAGNSASATASGISIDKTPPTVTATPDRPADHNGWYNHALTITFSGTDGLSDAVTCDDPVVYSGPDGASVTVTGSCTDAAGNSASASFTFNYDATAPTITAALDRSPASTGWFNIATGAPTVSYTCTDATSGIASCTAPYTFGEGADQSHIGTAVDAAGNSATASVSDVDVDLTAPTITYLGQTPAPNANGWNNTEVTLSWSCTDATSGPVSPTVSETLSSEGANQSATGTCTDAAGNTASDTQSGIDIDLTPPTNIQWVGGPADGGSYYFGFVPAAPTCTAEDALSGLAGCVVSGYGTSVGSYTMTATATDNADNVATATRTYTVLAWEVFGFYRPVDPIPTVNVVKAGSTVPLKFEAFAGSLELTNTTIVDSLTYRQVQCGAFEDMSESPVELTATGGTVLRYDWTAGQFVFNWKTPSTPNKCYTTTLLFDDGSTISAYFKLK